MMSHRRAPRTEAAYAHSWARFAAWCGSAGRDPLPASPETLCLYVASCVDECLRLASVRLYLSAIRNRHRSAGHGCDTGRGSEVRELVNSAARALKERPGGRVPLTLEQVRSLSHLLSRLPSPKAARDRAIIVLGFALGWRGSELAALQLSDVRFSGGGLRVQQWGCKTDQEGVGRVVQIPPGRRVLTCPVRVLRAWLNVRGRWPGPLFCAVNWRGDVLRNGISCDVVRSVVKGWVSSVGEDSGQFGSHSMRAGMATAGAEAGASELAIMQRGGWKSIAMVARYVRPVVAAKADPLAGVL